MKTQPVTQEPDLLDADADAVAAKLGVSARLVRRLADRGAMPAPVRISRLVRWRRADVNAWVGAGCPARSTKR